MKKIYDPFIVIVDATNKDKIEDIEFYVDAVLSHHKFNNKDGYQEDFVFIEFGEKLQIVNRSLVGQFSGTMLDFGDKFDLNDAVDYALKIQEKLLEVYAKKQIDHLGFKFLLLVDKCPKDKYRFNSLIDELNYAAERIITIPLSKNISLDEDISSTFSNSVINTSYLDEFFDYFFSEYLDSNNHEKVKLEFDPKELDDVEL